MDVLELLRHHRAAAAPPDSETIARARAVLIEAVRAEQAVAPAPTATRARLRRALVFVTAGLAVMLMVSALVIGTEPGAGPVATNIAAASVEMVPSGNRWEIRFLEPAAPPEAIDKAIAELGLDIKVGFVAASPSLEWDVVATVGDIEFLPPKDPDDSPAVRVPQDYDGTAELWVGRPAEAGEHYVSSPALGAEAPGEALHCSGIFGMPVRDAVPLLQERGLRAEWRVDDEGGTAAPEDIADRFVTESVPLAHGEVVLWTATNPPPGRDEWLSPSALAELTEGCPSEGRADG